MLETRFDGSACSTGGTAGWKNFPLSAIERGKWTDFVVNVKCSYGSDGFMMVWKNGNPIVNATGPNFYNDRMGSYFKFGIYKWSWMNNSSSVTERVLFFDEFKAGKPNSSYLGVSP